jgi:hypothetical protein
MLFKIKELTHVKIEKSRAFLGYALGKDGSSHAGYVLDDSNGCTAASVRGLARLRLIASPVLQQAKKENAATANRTVAALLTAF